MTDSNPLDDATLEKRINLATEMILTGGVITAEDIARGWWDAPNPADEMQGIAILLAITVICGGLNGALRDEVVDAYDDERLRLAALRAVLNAVQTIRADQEVGA